MADLFDEIAQALARRTGSEDTRVSEVIRAFFSGVERELLRGEKQSIPGLGQFQFKDGRVHFKPAKILRDWLVENTIPDGPLPENLLLNETQKSILQNLETSYPNLPALDELNLEQGKQDQARTVEVETKAVVLASDLREEQSDTKSKTSPVAMPRKQEPVAVKEKNPAPETEKLPAEKTESFSNSANHEVKKLKMILYATVGGCALVLLLVAVISIPWPKPQKIHFRDVKVPLSETGFYRIAVPPVQSKR
ncbi:MAG: HU family DNA-binding protein [Spirochaetia bacterium]|nr:HU family DNA-binding protein [Spirochaetia bacterium]